MHIVIMGCGRVGAHLANTMHREHSVVIIDQSPEALKRLSPDFSGKTLIGPGDDPGVLVKADIHHADVFAALTNRDNANIMGSQMARELFQVPRVITRIYDHQREDIYHDLGLETFCPTEAAVAVFEDILTS